MSFTINNLSERDGSVSIKLDLSKLDKQFKEAQKRLNMQIVADSTVYVPFAQGQLRSQVRYPDGLEGGIIEWYAPYAHYQYSGTVYTDALGRTWVGKGETKPINTGRPLTYHAPGTGARWFEQAKSKHLNDWIALAGRIAGGGNA